MFLDLVQPDKQCSFNIKLAHAIGLQSAIYCCELLNILGQVIKKDKFVDNDYFKLNRQYMTDRTTLSVEEQLNIDQALSKINLITKHNNNQDCIKLDVKLLVDIIANEDVNVNDDLLKRTKLKTSKEAQNTKRNAIKETLKDGIICSNYELLTSLRNWVDSVYESGKVLSKTKIKTFQDTLNNYTKGDLDLALRLVQIATIKAYLDCSWAINLYEKDQKYKQVSSKNEVLARTTTDNVIKSKDELSDIGY